MNALALVLAVTASRYAQPLNRTTAHVSVMTAAEVRQRRHGPRRAAERLDARRGRRRARAGCLRERLVPPREGGGLQWSRPFDAFASSVTAGVDLRHVYARNNQDDYSATGVYQRSLSSGGQQTNAGVYAQLGFEPAPGLTLDRQARLHLHERDDPRERDGVLRKIDFFTPLTVGQLEQVLPTVMLFAYDTGEKVFSQGQKGDAFYIVYKGKVEIKIREWLVLSKKIATLKEGDFLGEIALISDEPRTASVIATEPTLLFTLLADDFKFVLTENPLAAEEMRKIGKRRKFASDHKAAS